MAEIIFPRPPRILDSLLSVFPSPVELPEVAGEWVPDEASGQPETRWEDSIFKAVGRMPPHQMYTVGEDLMEAARGDEWLRRVTFYGWRNLLENARGIEAAVVRKVLPWDDAGLVEFNIGPYVKGTYEAREKLDVTAKRLAGRYEFRVLIVPHLHVFVVWLFPLDEGNGNYFWPVPPVPQPDGSFSSNESELKTGGEFRYFLSELM